MLSMMLVFRLMILENIEIITKTPSESEIRTSLKRPHSPKQDDGFISSIKKNVSATTPDDITSNSRLKSIFKKGKDKK